MMKEDDQSMDPEAAETGGVRPIQAGSLRHRLGLCTWFFCVWVAAAWLGSSAVLATEWQRLEDAERCVGGERCGRFSALRFELDTRPVEAVRFEAHDDIGSSFEGRIRIRIDGQVIVESLPVDRQERPFRIGASELVGRMLILEPAADDEVVISRIEVGYADRGREQEPRDEHWRRRPPQSSGSSSDSWEREREERRRTDLDLRGWGPDGGESRLAFLEEVGCLGGMRCRNSSITVRFRRSAPVGKIRFFAHDNLGETTRGRLRVLLDGQILADDLDIPAAGRSYEFSGGGRMASRLTFEPVSNEEVLVKDLVVEVARDREFGRRTGTSPESDRERAAESDLPTGTWCLGGDVCGRRWSLEIPLRGSVSAVRFFGSADIGQGFGRLKLVAGRGDLLGEWTIDRRGDFYEVEIPKDIDMLFMEAVEGDMRIEEVELRFGGSWERYRGDGDG